MSAQERWHESMASRVDHHDECWLADGGCSAPFGPGRPVACPEGRRLAEVEHAAHEAWRAERTARVVVR